jgi:hypothetical protein
MNRSEALQSLQYISEVKMAMRGAGHVPDTIRISPQDYQDLCAAVGDELIQIAGLDLELDHSAGSGVWTIYTASKGAGDEVDL